ncbi:phage head-tail connector protein [Nocardia wallacei]|uniref:phage head-tail connector protein n=1 Tax=Nocardia wallacei TaxID=480035 RepID=UPI0024584D5C|nr:phage head-tail connector protein [Nocardia wallacei]
MTSPVPATTLAAVKTYLAITDDRDDAAITAVVDAVNDLIASWLPVPGAGTGWPPRHAQGATMLAARVFRRRNSPNGVEDYGSELQGAIYTRANDPDIALLLGLGRYEPPSVG